MPDGTAITFTTEGAQIGGQCSTTNGACTVDWVSSNPRPDNGRSSILATAIGEEGFSDNDGNGTFGDGDGGNGAFDDIPEPYLDANENESRESGEPFFDFNTNGVYDAADGFYNGLLCEHSSLCSTVSDTAGIGEGTLIIMSGSEAVVHAEINGTPITEIDLNGAPATVVFFVGDLRDQPMPAETSIVLEVTNGSLVGPDSFNQPCTTSEGPIPYAFALEPDNDPGDSGTAFLTITTPGGLTTTVNMPITD